MRPPLTQPYHPSSSAAQAGLGVKYPMNNALLGSGSGSALPASLSANCSARTTDL